MTQALLFWTEKSKIQIQNPSSTKNKMNKLKKNGLWKALVFIRGKFSQSLMKKWIQIKFLKWLDGDGILMVRKKILKNKKIKFLHQPFEVLYHLSYSLQNLFIHELFIFFSNFQMYSKIISLLIWLTLRICFNKFCWTYFFFKHSFPPQFMVFVNL